MIKTIGVFLQEQLLGMRWLNQLVGNLLQAIGIDLESRMGASVQFFIYDIIKIFILLSVLIFSISYIQSFFSTGADQKDSGQVPWNRSQHAGCAAGHGNSLLFLLLHPAVYRLYQRRSAAGCHLFFPDFLAAGRFRLAGHVDRQLWQQGRPGVCAGRSGAGGAGRDAD